MAFTFRPEIEAADEAFWKKQERRKRGFLGQPCCTQSKMSWAMMDVPGDFALVVHGEYDCLNCFHHHTGPSAHQFYSSRLSDHQITTGDTQRPLEHLLRLIVAQRAPKAIVVLGTCPVEVTGARFETVADKVQADTGTPILAMHTSGLKMTSLTDCQDWLFDNLASLPQVAAVDEHWAAQARDVALEVVLTDQTLSSERAQVLSERLSDLPKPVAPDRALRLNFLGLPAPAREPVEVLGALGLSVNGFYPHGATLEHWRAVSQAEVTFAVDPGVFPRLVKRLEGQHGQRVEGVSLPIGVAATVRFYATLAASFGRQAALEDALAERTAAAHAKVAAFKASFGGVRMGMAIRMLNTFQVDRLVQDGLGDLEHLLELGFVVTLLVQGPPEEGEKFEARLRARGVQVDVGTFAGPFELGERLARDGYEVCHVPDSSRNLVRRAGLPMISSRALHPWLDGIDHNLGVLTALVEEGRRMGAAR